jgi:hypothetical protein
VNPHFAPPENTQEERHVNRAYAFSGPEQVVDTMVGLTRMSSPQRAIVAGCDRMQVYLALRRRGFVRTATPETSRIPTGQHTIGLITGQNSLQAIEAALAQVAPFLSASADIAVLIDSRESGVCLKIRTRLEQMGFRIEAGVRCQQGLVLSAHRHDFGQMEQAA